MPSVRLAYEIEQKETETALFEPLQPHLSLLSFSAENKKQRAILPTEFLMKLKVWVKKKEKVVIFYNRRGIKSEKVQEVLKKLLPRSTELVSITADTEVVRPADVIVGTSALFPYLAELKADHVVWLFPEVNLLYPDFRSRERAMFTLSRLQLSLKKGKAVEIVTRHPYLIKERLDIDLTTYFSEELKERKKLSFPPYTDMVRLRFKAKTKKAAYQQAVLIREQLISRHGHSTETFIIRGPFGIDEVYVLLLGRLSYLKKLYDSLPINSLDLDPHHIF